MIDFATLDVSADEHRKIAAAVKRVAVLVGGDVDVLSRSMDLAVVHASTPLDLDAMAEGDVGDVAHDVFGIARHLDRETGRLGGCFVPRFAVRPVFSKESAVIGCVDCGNPIRASVKRCAGCAKKMVARSNQRLDQQGFILDVHNGTIGIVRDGRRTEIQENENG